MFTRLSHQSAANIYDRITKMMSPQQQGKNRGGKLQDIDVHMSSISCSLIIGGPRGGPVHADVTTQGPPTRLEANSKPEHSGLSQDTNPLSHPDAILQYE